MVSAADSLAKALSRLPGLGRRSASRAALALLREPERLADPLALALRSARERVRCCSLCGNFTDKDENPCELCTSALRDSSLLCVVEEPSDIAAIEASGAFKGRYHALMGKLSPVRRMGPGDLRIDALRSRVAAGGFTEVLLALSTDMEGDATASYIAEVLGRFPGVEVTRLAFGLPADSGVAYSDPLTLKRAISARREV